MKSQQYKQRLKIKLEPDIPKRNHRKFFNID